MVNANRLLAHGLEEYPDSIYDCIVCNHIVKNLLDGEFMCPACLAVFDEEMIISANSNEEK